MSQKLRFRPVQDRVAEPNQFCCPVLAAGSERNGTPHVASSWPALQRSGQMRQGLFQMRAWPTFNWMCR
jgi:hypothetical protein